MTAAYSPIMLGPIPVDFILFALILAGIAFFHDKTFPIALGGLLIITLYKVIFTGFKQGPGLAGFAALMWVHVDFEQRTIPILDNAHLPAATCAADDCLHAPAGDPSVPAASSVFPAGGASSLDVPPLPTF